MHISYKLFGIELCRYRYDTDLKEQSITVYIAKYLNLGYENIIYLTMIKTDGDD
jgi:hypothetical protein